jgi:hypothetical protein
MPSEFSPHLRLELIKQGEQAGTWGTTTNTNLGTLIERAIAGWTPVTILSAAQALTVANGADDQARNAVVEFVTAPGAFSAFVPPFPKQYTIVNSTAHAATVFNSTALGNTTPRGAGVVIPAGKSLAVWTDGTDVHLQTTLVVGDVVGNVVGNVTGNVTGQLSGSLTAGVTGATQPFGTNNTTVSTTAFVQAALQALHPVGSVYINATNAANPATYFGFGTWTAFGAGRVPVGFNAADPLFDTAEETGGSKDAIVVSHTHTGTTASSGAHEHSVTIPVGNSSGTALIEVAGGSLGSRSYTTSSAGAHDHTFTTASTGSSGTNANLPPYITVFMWKRTA